MIKSEKKKILSALLVIAFGVSVFLAGYYGEYAGDTISPAATLDLSQDSVADEVKYRDESGEIKIDFELLQAQNPDIYAWITVPGTGIDYPVLQKSGTEDIYDNYYLDHKADLSEGLPGAIYTQPVNSRDFKDSVTVLYGHNMKNGGMFSSLHEFEDRDFFEKNRQIIIYTPDNTFVYEIFAAADFSDVLIPYEYDFNDDSEILRYLEDVEECRGNFRNETEVLKSDKILTLSTCYSGRDENRLLIQAVLTEEIQA